MSHELSTSSLSSATGGVVVEAETAAAGEKDVTSLSRRHFLAMSVAAGGAAMLLSSVPGRADILDTLNKGLDLDPIVLNYAHELEELQAEFFLRVSRSAAYHQLEGRERSVINHIAKQDRAHFEALGKLRDVRGNKMGGHFESPNASASRRPRSFRFPASAFQSRDGLLPVAVEIKESAVAAYHGAVDLLADKDGLLAPAAAIAGVDGRHLVLLREIAGMDPVPSPFENQISPQTIGDRLAKYGFRGGAMRQGLVK